MRGRDNGIDPNFLAAAKKYSVTIAGHPTSVRIESLFWDALLSESRARGLPLNALVAQIDASRLAASPPAERPPNLASAIRLWLFAQSQARAEVDG